MRISNIVFEIDQIFIHNMFLMDNKRNIIMDGKFTKIVYSDDLFITNGIFIQVSFILDNFSISSKDCIENPATNNTPFTKCFLLFKATDAYNEKIIQELIKIEYAILDFYKQTFKCDKKSTNILKSQLHNGCIKSYIDITEYDKLSRSQFPMKLDFVLKISGIWEDYNNIGLTYKFVSPSLPYN